MPILLLKWKGAFFNVTIMFRVGCQWDYVVFSTVRSIDYNKKIKNPTLCTCNMDFITDENQMNVALTCARKKLIIIGIHAKTLF